MEVRKYTVTLKLECDPSVYDPEAIEDEFRAIIAKYFNDELTSIKVGD